MNNFVFKVSITNINEDPRKWKILVKVLLGSTGDSKKFKKKIIIISPRFVKIFMKNYYFFVQKVIVLHFYCHLLKIINNINTDIKSVHKLLNYKILKFEGSQSLLFFFIYFLLD